MALNLETEGKPLCRIIGKGKKVHKLIYVADDESNVMNSFKSIQCKNDEYMQHIPNFLNERDVLYICGKSGSGKTHYMKNYIRQYNIVYPTRPIYILSTIDNDPSLEGIKNVNYIDITTIDFLEADLSSTDFQDSLVCFDDIDCIKDKILRKKIDSILTLLLQIGRHTNTSVIYISHQACKGNETKAILNECHGITFFIRGMGGKSLKYLLENYLSLDKNQIEQVKKLKSRHITIFNTYPTCVLYDKGIYILEN